ANSMTADGLKIICEDSSQSEQCNGYISGIVNSIPSWNFRSNYCVNNDRTLSLEIVQNQKRNPIKNKSSVDLLIFVLDRYYSCGLTKSHQALARSINGNDFISGCDEFSLYCSYYIYGSYMYFVTHNDTTLSTLGIQ